jgi:hypothetical protein
MNTLTRSLLGGAAISGLMAAPAASQQNYRLPISITAMHAGRAVNKTQRYNCEKFSCTATVFTYLPVSGFGQKVPVPNTFYKYNNSGDLCSNPKQTIHAREKTRYATINAGSTTYYEGCPGQQPTFYGDYYTLTNKKGFGKVDTFESILRATFYSGGTKYKGQFVLQVNVFNDPDQPAEHSN